MLRISLCFFCLGFVNYFGSLCLWFSSNVEKFMSLFIQIFFFPNFFRLRLLECVLLSHRIIDVLFSLFNLCFIVDCFYHYVLSTFSSTVSNILLIILYFLFMYHIFNLLCLLFRMCIYNVFFICENYFGAFLYFFV